MNCPEPEFAAPGSGLQSAPAGGATIFSCALCGCRFTHAGRSCLPCTLSAFCDLVQCPNCGFQFPRTSRTLEWARRLFERRRRQ
jgi:hypothetical protein